MTARLQEGVIEWRHCKVLPEPRDLRLKRGNQAKE